MYTFNTFQRNQWETLAIKYILISNRFPLDIRAILGRERSRNSALCSKGRFSDTGVTFRLTGFQKSLCLCVCLCMATYSLQYKHHNRKYKTTRFMSSKA